MTTSVCGAAERQGGTELSQVTRGRANKGHAGSSTPCMPPSGPGRCAAPVPPVGSCCLPTACCTAAHLRHVCLRQQEDADNGVVLDAVVLGLRVVTGAWVLFMVTTQHETRATGRAATVNHQASAPTAAPPLLPPPTWPTSFRLLMYISMSKRPRGTSTPTWARGVACKRQRVLGPVRRPLKVLQCSPATCCARRQHHTQAAATPGKQLGSPPPLLSPGQRWPRRHRWQHPRR